VSGSASIETALHTTLSSDTSLMALVSGIYRNLAPPDATYPFVLYQLIVSGDKYTLTQRVSSEYSFQIKVVAEGYSAVSAKTALDRVDVLLTDKSLSVTGKTHWKTRRTSEFEYAEMGEFGVVYQHVGGNWQIEMA
jgi:hypothetical protein